MPRLPACYVVLLHGRAVYVGQTGNLRGRFVQHSFKCGYSQTVFTPWGDQIAPAALVVKVRFADRYGDWAMRELRLIRRLQPSMNCVGSVKKRSKVAA